MAFASDVIPGKHWVLQISQAMDPDGEHSIPYHADPTVHILLFKSGLLRRAFHLCTRWLSYPTINADPPQVHPLQIHDLCSRGLPSEAQITVGRQPAFYWF